MFLLPGRHVGDGFSNLTAEEVLGVAARYPGGVTPHANAALCFLARKTAAAECSVSLPWKNLASAEE